MALAIFAFGFAVAARAATPAATATAYVLIEDATIQAVDPIHEFGGVVLGSVPGWTEEQSDVLYENAGSYGLLSVSYADSNQDSFEYSNFKSQDLAAYRPNYYGIPLGDARIGSGDLGVSTQAFASRGGSVVSFVEQKTDGFYLIGNYYLQVGPNTRLDWGLDGFVGAEANCELPNCGSSAYWSINTRVIQGNDSYTSGINFVSTNSSGEYFEYADSGDVLSVSFVNASLTEVAVFAYTITAEAIARVDYGAPSWIDGDDVVRGFLPPVSSVPELSSSALFLLGLGAGVIATRRGLRSAVYRST